MTHPSRDHPSQAALFILGYAVIIGFTDNFVRIIAQELGVWQFHAMRSGISLILMAAVVMFWRMKAWPLRPRAVFLRSMVHALAMIFYFGALAFVPVAQASAGLFTAPIFVLLISRFAFGQNLNGIQILAVLVGFIGIIMVLDLRGQTEFSWASVLPILGGFFYALGNIATRRWCEGESAVVITGGYFLMVGIFGLVGLAGLAIIAPDVPEGSAGFVLRGAAIPTFEGLGWIVMQAAGSVLGVALMVRGYQLTDATRASVLEYSLMPGAALWGWVIWNEVPSLMAVMGMALIFASGLLIARAPR